MKKDGEGLSCLRPAADMIIDLVRDKRISLEIRKEYADRIDKDFPAFMLLTTYDVTKLNRKE